MRVTRQPRSAALELFEAVTALARVYQFRDRDRICCRDLTVTQWYALEVLRRVGACSLNALARELNLEKSTASRLVGELERRRYVQRRAHPGDGRSVFISATARGLRAFATVRRDLLREHARVITGLDSATQRAVGDVIRQLALATAQRSGLSVRIGTRRARLWPAELHVFRRRNGRLAP
jgi:MarR family 2-MHQ and catechol resistance regulon transcriptional repressor